MADGKVGDKGGLGSTIAGWVKGLTDRKPQGVDSLPQPDPVPAETSLFQPRESTLQDLLYGKGSLPPEAAAQSLATTSRHQRYDAVVLTPAVKQHLIETAPTSESITINLQDQPDKYVTAEMSSTVEGIIKANPNVQLTINWADGTALTWTPRPNGGGLDIRPAGDQAKQFMHMWTIGRLNALDRVLTQEFGSHYKISVIVPSSVALEIIKLVNSSLNATATQLASWQRTAYGSLSAANTYLQYGMTQFPGYIADTLASTSTHNDILMKKLADSVETSHKLLRILEGVIPVDEAVQRFYRAIRRLAHDTNNSLTRLGFVSLFASSLIDGRYERNLDRVLPPSSNLVQLVDSVVHQYEAKADTSKPDGKAVVATYQKPPMELQFTETVNAVEFDRAVTNIVSNAFRYGNGSVNVYYEPVSVNGRVVGVTLHVLDNGIGIENLEGYGSFGFQELRRDVSGSSGTGTYSMMETLMTLGLPFPAVTTTIGGGTDVALNIPNRFFTQDTQKALSASVDLNWSATTPMSTNDTKVLVFTPTGEQVILSSEEYKISQRLLESVAQSLSGKTDRLDKILPEIAALDATVQRNIFRAYSGIADARSFTVQNLYEAIEIFNAEAKTPLLFTASASIDASHPSLETIPVPDSIGFKSAQSSNNELRLDIVDSATGELSLRSLSEAFIARISEPTRLTVQIDSLSGDNPAFKQFVRSFETTLFPTTFASVSFQTADQSIELGYRATASQDRRIPEVRIQLPTFADVSRVLDSLTTMLSETFSTIAPGVVGSSVEWVTNTLQTAVSDNRVSPDNIVGEQLRIGRLVIEAFGTYLATFGPLSISSVDPERQSQIIERFARELGGGSTVSTYPWWLQSQRVPSMIIDVAQELASLDVASLQKQLPDNYQLRSSSTPTGTRLEITTATPPTPSNPTGDGGGSGPDRFSLLPYGADTHVTSTTTLLMPDGSILSDLLGAGDRGTAGYRMGLEVLSLEAPFTGFRPVEVRKVTEAADAVERATLKVEGTMERGIRK